MFFVDKDIYAERLEEKSRIKVIANDKDLMLFHLYFESGGIEKAQCHKESQATYIISGRFEYNLDGETRVLTAGDSVYIPANTLHSMVCLEKGETLNALTPTRKDFEF